MIVMRPQSRKVTRISIDEEVNAGTDTSAEVENIIGVTPQTFDAIQLEAISAFRCKR